MCLHMLTVAFGMVGELVGAPAKSDELKILAESTAEVMNKHGGAGWKYADEAFAGMIAASILLRMWKDGAETRAERKAEKHRLARRQPPAGDLEAPAA